jgi:probable phosphoglycerate mutase
MTTRLILVMPGVTDWSAAGRIQGQLDIPLNAEGKKQIQLIVSSLARLKGVKSIDALYSSRLSRSVETAESIADVFKLRLNKMREFNELNCGLWQGLLEKQAKKRYRKLYHIWKASPLLSAPPKGEPLADAYDRVASAAKKAVEKFRGQAVCVVSHEIAGALIKCYYKKIGPENLWAHIPKNGSVEVIEIKNG